MAADSAVETATAPPPERTRRRDAVANQSRIIEAARQVFAEQGLDVALGEISNQAGVGLATLTRHFTRVQLVEAVFVDLTNEHRALLDDALALPASEGVTHYLRAACTQQLKDRSVCQALTLSLPKSPEVSAHREVIRERQLRLIRRARRAGSIRAGIVPEDFAFILEAVSGLMHSGPPNAWERVFTLLVDGLGAAEPNTSLPAAPGPGAFRTVVRAPSRGRRIGAI